jgi:hypothetical protein
MVVWSAKIGPKFMKKFCGGRRPGKNLTLPVNPSRCLAAGRRGSSQVRELGKEREMNQRAVAARFRESDLVPPGRPWWLEENVEPG